MFVVIHWLVDEDEYGMERGGGPYPKLTKHHLECNLFLFRLIEALLLSDFSGLFYRRLN